MVIRPLETHDQQLVEQMMTEYPLQFPKFIINQYPSRWAAYLESSHNRSGYFVVAADTILGHAGYNYNEQLEMYEIVGVVIKKDRQRQGIGNKLIEAICNQIQSLGDNQVVLYTLGHPGNEDTLNFYRNIGFNEGKWETDYYDSGYHRVIFMKDLT